MTQRGSIRRARSVAPASGAPRCESDRRDCRPDAEAGAADAMGGAVSVGSVARLVVRGRWRPYLGVRDVSSPG